MSIIRVEVEFLEGVLGSQSNNPDIYADFIGSKAPTADTLDEELEAIENVDTPEIDSKGITVFPRLPDGTPFLYDYQVKGFFKDTCGVLNKLTGKDPATGKKGKAVNESSKITQYKKVIDGLIFVQPRKIPFKIGDRFATPDDLTMCQRPLRAQTMKGERVALACSEEIPKGAKISFDVICQNSEHVSAVVEWLKQGFMRGLSQWRNSGKGRFVFTAVDDNGKVLADNMFLKETYDPYANGVGGK